MRWLVAVVAVSAVVGCATAVPSASPATTPSANPSNRPTSTAAAGFGLCAAFTPDLAIAALGGPVAEPRAGVVLGSTAIYCEYMAVADPASQVQANVEGATRTECEEHAHFLGMRTPISGVGEVAYHMDRTQMGDTDAFVIAWANGKCVIVTIKSAGGQAALLEAADSIAIRVLQPPP